MESKSLAVIFSWALGSFALAQSDLSQDQVEFFENEIRPALSKYCYECHSEEFGKVRGGLLVDTRVGLLQGGDTGPAIVPGDVVGSLFWDAVSWSDPDYQMPPKQKMPDDVIAAMKKWIEMGAPDPRVKETVVVENTIDLEEGRKHWAFQAPAAAGGSIDQYVDAKLHEAGLKPAADAEPATLLRRLNFDLIGLPPTTDEVLGFLKSWESNSETALAAKVDELLARPQFGERWGRHWLDVARYAESTGMDVNFTYPFAWRYRDWVIDAFNADMPYDKFIQAQIAGDLLPTPSDEEWQQNLIATGFLAVGTKGLNEPNPRKFHMDVVDEQIDTMSQAVLGLTVACARCHDHKYDPIPTADYYSLAGIFASTKTFYGTNEALQNKRPSKLLELPIEDTTFASQTYTAEELEEMQEELATLRERMRGLRSEEGMNQANAQQMRVRTRAMISLIGQKLEMVNEDGTPKSFAMGVQDGDEIGDTNVLVRGEVEKPAQVVERGFLQVLNFTEPIEIKDDRSGRRELAKWLTSKENPLTARVMVNRVWQKLFGQAIVTTPNNWGLTGQEPSHPQLLDHLAVQFMNNEWSTKSVIREIVLSKTYRRSSEFNSANFAADPDNKLLWRAKPRQLDAEALRDGMLAVSGNLNLERPAGSAVSQMGGGRVARQINASEFENVHHRAIYLPLIRDMLPESMSLFDFPDPSVISAKRDETNMPSQALFLMNNAFVETQAEVMAQQLLDRKLSREDRVRAAFAQAYGRSATSEEIQTCLKYFQQFSAVASRKSVGDVDKLATAALCQTLLTSAEFRILN